MAAVSPDGDAGQRQAAGLAQDQAIYGAAARPERHPHPHLAGPLTGGVGDRRGGDPLRQDRFAEDAQVTVDLRIAATGDGSVAAGSSAVRTTTAKLVSPLWASGR